MGAELTWSIIARDPTTGGLAIAVSTCAFAVGARVPFIETGVGAVATQAFVNPFYGPRGLGLLRLGVPPDDAMRLVTQADEGRDHRQLHLMDAAGCSAAMTGAACIPWCGHLIRDGVSVAGNMLSGPGVIEATADAYEAGTALPMPQRLIAALRAGEAAGGDKRGRESAALLIHDSEVYPALDLRVDNHDDPLSELARLEAVSRERFVHYRRFMPSRANPAGVTDRELMEAQIAKSMAEVAAQDAERALSAGGAAASQGGGG